MSSTESRAFYDEYVERQLRVGVNRRHEAIRDFALRFGLEPHHRVLEIGAGVGTVTGLLAAELDPDEGGVVGVDLSPRSIEAARARLARVPHARMEAGDVLEMELEGPFDVVVLPDVLEHIPLELHPALFGRIAGWLAPDGFVLAHYPNPHFLAWCHEHRPDLLQQVDQPIWADALTAAAYPAGLTLEYLETYAIWIEEGDYQVALFRPRSAVDDFRAIEERPGVVDRLRAMARRALDRVGGGGGGDDDSGDGDPAGA